MKRQLLREAHARNERSHKPDYQERFSDEGDDFDHGGQIPPKSRPHYQVKGNFLIIYPDPNYKSKPQSFLEHILRIEGLFKIHGYESKIGWSLDAFKKHNRLHGDLANDLHEEIITELEELFTITVKNLRRAEPFKVNKEGHDKTTYQFKSGLVPVRKLLTETKKFILDIDFINVKMAP